MTSEASPRRRIPEAAWRRIALTWLGTVAGALALFVLMVLLVDPYDSGRFPTFMPSGSPDDRQPTIAISRGRDPRFDAVLLGSSRAVLADPRHVSERTGYRFVELAIMGATPREQMALLHWFARHRPRVAAIVVAADQTWCERDPALPGMPDFPYGLYADSDLSYLKTTLSSATLTFAKDRISYALGRKPALDPAGYYDEEAALAWRWPDAAPVWRRTAAAPPEASIRLPALELLDASLRDVPGHPRILLWMPPYFRDDLPPADSDAGRSLLECKTALRHWAEARPQTAFLDLAIDTPAAGDRANFLDPTHVSNRFMRIIEVQLADALDRLK